MFKFLLTIAALLVSVPVQAQSISYERMQELSEKTKVACPIAIRSRESSSEVLLSMVYTRSLEEQFYVITLCKFFVMGKIEGLSV
jgi:hypothetical protein